MACGLVFVLDREGCEVNLSNVSTCHTWVPVRVFLESTQFDSFWMKLDWVTCSEKPPNKFEVLMGIKPVRLGLDHKSF